MKDKFKENLEKEVLHHAELKEPKPLPEGFYEDGSRCGNCQAILEPDDKYCRNCGTKRGEGKFSEYRNPLKVIYGPIRVFRCRECSFQWQSMIGKCCPKCGGKLSTGPDEKQER